MPIDIKKIKEYPHRLGNALGYTKLTDIHSEWIKKAWRNKNEYVLQAHRNSYKTTAVLVVGAIWYLFFNPDVTVLIVRKEYEGAASIIKEISKHYLSENLIALYQEVYGITSIIREDRKDSITLTTKTRVTKEGNIDSLGIGGSITGRHYDKVFTDDIITLKDRVSKAERESTKSFIRELTNIPVIGGTITHTGTPWHKEDGFSILPEPDKYPIGSVDIPELTEDVRIKLKSGMTSSLYAINYELKHIADENRIFVDPQYEAWPENTKRICALLDPSYSGKNTTALTMIAETHEKAHIRGWVWPNDVAELYDVIANILKNYKCGTLYNASKADKGYSTKDLRTRYPAVIDVDETMNKHIKIISFLKQNWSLLYFAHDCQPEYLNQILDYVEGEEPDDAPDSAANLVKEMNIGHGNELMNRFGITA
jgi:hypothetical protein